MTAKDAAAALEKHGLLLLQDAKALSLVGMITGEVLKGSWWSHAKANEIFAVAEQLEKDAKTAKLVDGKVTFVHRRLWPALQAVGTERDTWQMKGLSQAARELLVEVRDGPLRPSTPAQTKIAKDLELRLLVDARSVHSSGGKHVMELTRWEKSTLPPAEARAQLEAAAAAIGAAGRLPWQSSAAG